MLRLWTSRSSLQLSNIFHRWCLAVRSSLQVSNALPSLLLPSKIFSEFSSHHGCYSISFSLNIITAMLQNLLLFSNIIIHVELQDLLFNYLTSWNTFRDLVCKFLLSLLLRLWTSRFSFQFPNIFHHWCYAVRSSLHLANMIEATRQDLLFNFQRFYPHCCYAPGSSLQFSNIIDATLQVLLFSLPTFSHHWC